MKLVSLSVLLIAVIISFNSTSQEQQLLLRSGKYIVNHSETDWETSEVFDGKYHRILVFDAIPTSEEKNRLFNMGVELLDYLPRNAFYASIATTVNWEEMAGIKVVKIKADHKKSEPLSIEEYPHWTLFGVDKIELIAYHFDVSYAQLESDLRKVGGSIAQINTVEKTINVRVDLDRIYELYELPFFYYFETIPDTPRPENETGRTNHRSNTLYTEYSGGLQYSGNGVNVMMQDDGIIGPHIDYTGRIDQSNCVGCSTSANDTHADHVSGTIMGAGNLNPEYRGMAHGVDLDVYSSSDANYSLFPGLFDNDNIVITSKSYSNGCNAGYTSLTRLLDQQVRNRPQLTHVFSAGNDGTSNCGYGAGAGWGNITGGHKVGKNVIAVGNLSHVDGLANSSSRGPAEDGRIKPDICAVGSSVTSTGPENIYFTISGTSMSCPGVSGTIAQLYEGYRDINGGANPDAALIKSAVLNTGEDLGNPGPDFKFGWGRINARQAWDLISNNQYIQDDISQGNTDVHTINVPAGVSELRIMTYWSDYEGSTSAALALVNDLNMVVTDPAMQSFDPWVLDHTPNATALNTNAIRAVDALNNMEQVTIDNPTPGTYTVSVDGFAIPQGPQDYYIVYYFVRDELTVTYPIGGEGLVPGSHIVRWDASEGTDDFTIEYTTDNGSTWNTAGTANADKRYYLWTAPSTVTGLAKVRVSRNASSDESDAVFSIIETPSNLHFNWSCPDSLNIGWNAVSGATGYEVSMLGVKYMDSVGFTTSTDLTLPVTATTGTWFSVRALGPDNARGERAIAIEKTPGEFGCTWSSPYSAFDVDCDAAGTGHCFDLMNESINTDGASSYTWYFPGGTPSMSTDENPNVCYSTDGLYDVALVVQNAAGTDSIYQSSYIEVLETKALPYHEGFEGITNLQLTDDWDTYNPNNNQTFYVSTSAAHSGSKSVRLSNYSQTGNFTDELISGPIDLSVLGTSDIMTLSFRYSYRKKVSSNHEFLRVQVSKGCEENWVTRKTLFGDLLSPLTTTSSWIPSTEDDWTTVHMTNITSSYFTGDFRFKFQFESDNGNNLFIDDINIYQGNPSDDIISGLEENEITELSVYPNPTDEELHVSFGLGNTQLVQLSIVDLSGKEIRSFDLQASSGSNMALIDVNDIAPGMYMIKIKTSGTEELVRFVKK
jgi:PKD repeat protein